MPTIADRTSLSRIVVTIWGIIGALLLVGTMIWVGREVRIIWLPLVFATGIVVILNPLVSRFHRWGIPRVIGATIAYVLSLAALAGLGAALSVPVIQQIGELSDRLPDIYQALYVQIGGVVDRLGLPISLPEDTAQIAEWLRDNLGGLASLFGG